MPGPKQAFLFGTSISQSLSPVFHNACFKARQVDWELERIDSADMSAYLTKIREADLRFGGSAVTMPHKAAILDHVDHVEPQARIIGAANTIFLDPSDSNRRLHATNTDVAGICNSILASAQAAPPKDPIGIVVGGGGTTRTAVYTLRFELQCKDIFIINRLDAEVDSIIRDFARQGEANISQLKNPEQAACLRTCPHYIVNAVPSIEPQTSGEKLARATLLSVLTKGQPSEAGIFLEMCYFPHTWTTVCQMASDNHFRVIQGMECMYHQAIAQQCLWLGPAPPGIDLLQTGRAAAEAEVARREAGHPPQ